VNILEREEETYGDDIFSHFRSMPGKLGELPCIDETMSPVILWTIFPSFRKKLAEVEEVEIEISYTIIFGNVGRTCVLKTCTCPRIGWRMVTCEAALPTNQSPEATSSGVPLREYG
jgi:hypothetical protein